MMNHFAFLPCIRFTSRLTHSPNFFRVTSACYGIDDIASNLRARRNEIGFSLDSLLHLLPCFGLIPIELLDESVKVMRLGTALAIVRLESGIGGGAEFLHQLPRLLMPAQTVEREYHEE